MKRSAKILCAALALVLVLGCGIGGTFAWLSKKTGAVTNTFTYGNIDLELYETDEGQNTQAKNYVIYPGADLPKDPKVTISTPAGYEDVLSYVFVKVEEMAWPAKGVMYAVAKDWIPVPTVDGVYYQEITPSTAGVTKEILQGNHVTVEDTLTKDDIENMTQTLKESKLIFTAYAIQKAGFDSVNAAWTEVSKLK